MNVGETILYIQDNTGGIREWAISAEGNEITIRHGAMGGSMQYQTEIVERGKASRSLDEQVMSRMASRISKQRDKGYRPSINDAMSRPRNTLGLPKPMLAHKFVTVKKIDYEGSITQPKFDGNRCLLYCENGVNKAYSRNGKPIEAIDHILRDIELPEGMIVDGELYHHGSPLQTIVSWIKRKQENTKLLKYHIYDVVSDLPYKARSEIIRTLPKGSAISPVYGVPTACKEAVFEAFREFREQGYEGAILRLDGTGYEDGKRSRSLIKIKEWESEEFIVIDIEPSREGWAILVCETDAGNTFKVSAPGTMIDKQTCFDNRERYVGRFVTVEYANVTKDGIPFHPIAVCWRDDLY